MRLCSATPSDPEAQKLETRYRLKAALRKIASKGRKAFFTKFREARLRREEAAAVQEVEGEAAEAVELEGSDGEDCDGPFKKGDEVLMAVEHPDFKRFLGCFAKVERMLPDLMVKVSFKDYLRHGFADRAVSAALLEHKPAGATSPDLKTLARSARHVKRWLLEAAGVHDPRFDLITALKPGDQASEDHLDLFASIVEWSFELGELGKVKVVPAMLANRMLSDARGDDYHLEEPLPPGAVIEKRRELLRAWHKRFEQLLIPVYAPQGEKSGQHWTLLSVRRTTNDFEVEYYDSRKDLHPMSLEGAHIFLSILGLNDHKIEERTNAALQTGQDCGWFVCHWIEELMRRQAGHLKQSQGWPYKARLTKLQAHLKRMIESLEGERQKWALEVEEGIKHDAELESKLRAISEEYFLKRELASRVVEEHRALGKALLEAGSAVAAPPLDKDARV